MRYRPFWLLALLVVSASTAVHAERVEDQEGVYPLPEPGLPPKTLVGAGATRTAAPSALPDIYGPGAVLNVGNLHMKVTNQGVIGNPFIHISSDPSAQWPGPSGVEYLRSLVLAVGAVDPRATDRRTRRRVSSGIEWRPATTDPVDRIYRSNEGSVGGRYLINDDRDADATGSLRVDEEFLDGRDDDGDRLTDEDYAAFGDLMYSCVMRDDTPAAINMVGLERHVPLGLECRQNTWAYSIPGFANFNVIEYTIVNRSGHTLDSVYVAFPVDLDAGSYSQSAAFYMDDKDVPVFPHGRFTITVPESDGRRLGGCFKRVVEVNGFSVVDGDGDGGRTPGVVSLLLLGHTIDTFGVFAPESVAFRTFRSYVAGTSYASRGAPATDQQRYELMTSRENVGGEGFISAPSSGELGDYVAWNSIGPFKTLADGASITATIAITVSPGTYEQLMQYPKDYALYRIGRLNLDALLARYPALENALTAQTAYDGLYEPPRPGFSHLVPSCYGCETGIKLPPGSPPVLVTERSGWWCGAEPAIRWVTDQNFTWFNNDCDFCTGVPGHYLRRWDSRVPPLSPNLNVSAIHNYSDNPDRVVVAGDNSITLAWDNLSEATPDPKQGWFDFRSYQVWRAAGWERRPGTAGPSDDEWELLSELRLFDYADSNFHHDLATDTLVCPMVQVPNHEYPAGHEHCAPSTAAWYPNRIPLHNGGCRDTATIGICLRRGDAWDRQSGRVVRADPAVDCVRDSIGQCVQTRARRVGTAAVIAKTRYPIGRYRLVDREVRNGFVYFYSVTAGDSSGEGEVFGRRSTVEADAVVPQASTRPSGKAWVVPNPYRGFHSIRERPSRWDLHPSPSDPTGTHVDFMGLPRGPWTIRIYTVAGDLVAELHDDDPLNESVRKPVTDAQGASRPGFNRQQEHPDDGQARWNLISRNGQDVMSGIYVFVVDSAQGQQRGKFVLIR